MGLDGTYAGSFCVHSLHKHTRSLSPCVLIGGMWYLH